MDIQSYEILNYQGMKIRVINTHAYTYLVFRDVFKAFGYSDGNDKLILKTERKGADVRKFYFTADNKGRKTTFIRADHLKYIKPRLKRGKEAFDSFLTWYETQLLTKNTNKKLENDSLLKFVEKQIEAREKKPAPMEKYKPFSIDRTGWICPICGKGLSPQVTSCSCAAVDVHLVAHTHSSPNSHLNFNHQ